MNKPTGAFALTLVGGAVSMIGLNSAILSIYRSFPDTVSAGAFIIILSILLHEMPERNITFGAVVIAVSSAQLISSIIVIVIAGGLYTDYLAFIPYMPLAGSIISLLGGVAALLWKPQRPS